MQNPNIGVQPAKFSVAGKCFFCVFAFLSAAKFDPRLDLIISEEKRCAIWIEAIWQLDTPHKDYLLRSRLVHYTIIIHEGKPRLIR